MSITVCLLLYSIAIAVIGPPVLVRLTDRGIAPHLGVAAWCAAIAGVVLAWFGSVVTLVAEFAPSWNQPARWVTDCFTGLAERADGVSGAALRILLVVLSVSAVLAFSAAAWRTARGLLRMRARTHRHARMARIIGRRIAGFDAVILDAPARAAYCVAGRPHTIIITSGALAALDQRQLGAVLAHERAHLSGRHHQLLALVRGLAASLPGVRLFSMGAVEIARLLEMCADDTAARTHGSSALLGGLLTLSGAPPAPAGTLAATGVDVLTRASRLAAPPSLSTHVRTGALLSTAIAVIALGPVMFGLLSAAGVIMCGPMGS
ncbi:M56 family metallopeptidase [Rhodococcus opacus]|uniref:M56 family metallopeptidase n=1 Tax=Rhodococcus opacus TaxID=37919 RepID=UPI001C475BEF|nr:M56 family metallopeptidase [Rhodococcus opacus]MBV6760626.1 M56 family metallopeptidase [Rhodococcus opacus]